MLGTWIESILRRFGYIRLDEYRRALLERWPGDSALASPIEDAPTPTIAPIAPPPPLPPPEEPHHRTERAAVLRSLPSIPVPAPAHVVVPAHLVHDGWSVRPSRAIGFARPDRRPEPGAFYGDTVVDVEPLGMTASLRGRR